MTERHTDDAVRALIRVAHFGGDVDAAQVCQEWADQYDDDNTPEPVKPEPAKTAPPKK